MLAIQPVCLLTTANMAPSGWYHVSSYQEILEVQTTLDSSRYWVSWDHIWSLFAWLQGTFASDRPATSIWSAPIVVVLVITSRPSWIPIPFTFWKAFLVQLSGLSTSGPPVVSVSIALLLGSEMDSRLRPKQSLRESYSSSFISAATAFSLYSDWWMHWGCIVVDCILRF